LYGEAGACRPEAVEAAVVDAEVGRIGFAGAADATAPGR
jgi:hypothetical protein